MQEGSALNDEEQLVLERWLDEAKFSRVLKPSTHREAIQRVLCHYVFDSRMSQLQAIAVSVSYSFSCSLRCTYSTVALVLPISIVASTVV